MAATATIIAAIIGAGVAVGTSIYSSSQMDKAQDEARGIAGRQEATSNRQFAENVKLQKAQLAQQATLTREGTAESARQFNIEAGRAQENDAYTKFENQFQKLAGYMSKNQELEDLFINRLKGLRGE